MKWAELPVFDKDYYRDLAVNLNVVGGNQRTVLFTHAYIRTEIVNVTKSDYVTVKVAVKQKEDKYVGVVFGLDLEDTYKKARERVENPPRINIWVPIKSAGVNTEAIEYISPKDSSNRSTQRLRDLVYALGGTINEDLRKGTATVTIGNITKVYTNEKNGAVLDFNYEFRMFINGFSFASDFGAEYSEFNLGNDCKGYKIRKVLYDNGSTSKGVSYDAIFLEINSDDYAKKLQDAIDNQQQSLLDIATVASPFIDIPMELKSILWSEEVLGKLLKYGVKSGRRTYQKGDQIMSRVEIIFDGMKRPNHTTGGYLINSSGLIELYTIGNTRH